MVNYNLPEDPEDYVHRIGRTGRAGATGVSISFASEDDAFLLPTLRRFSPFAGLYGAASYFQRCCRNSSPKQGCPITAAGMTQLRRECR